MDRETPLELLSTSTELGPDAAFERALRREIIASESMRALVVAGVLTVLGIVDAGLALLDPGIFGQFTNADTPDLLPLEVLAPFVVYELIVLWALRTRLASGRDVPGYARLATATIETSLPTAILWVASRYAGPEIAFALWPSMLYFLFIVVSTLRLNFILPFYTGIVAGLSYLAVAHAVFDPARPTFQDLWFVLIPKAGAMIVSGLVAGLVGMRLGSKFRQATQQAVLRERVTNLFGQHVSPAVLDRLLASPTEIVNETREICVMFLDIRNFTANARQRSPGEVVEFLNEAFAFMIEAVDRNGGFINKFLGDGFMAIFGAPLEDPLAVSHALTAAREILAEIDRARLEEGPWPLRVGIGLHFGPAVTGNIGSPQRKEFTAIGDAVNLAARMEQLTKAHNARLIVSAAVMTALGEGGDGAVALGSVEVKGYPEPVPVWRLG